MKKTFITETESQNNLDHDTLIRVETKLDSLTQIVNDLQSGMVERIIKAEQRLDVIDQFHAKVDYDTLVPLINWTNGFRANLKFVAAIITIIATVFSGLIVLAIQKLFKM